MRVLLFVFLAGGICFGETVGLGVDWNDATRRKLEGIKVTASMEIAGASLDAPE